MHPLTVKTTGRRIVLGLCCTLFMAPHSGLADKPDTETKIMLGMSTALSGPAADLGKNMRVGVLAGLERANRSGGINGRTLQLIALDDGYEPSRTAPHMRRLIEQNAAGVISRRT